MTIYIILLIAVFAYGLLLKIDNNSKRIRILFLFLSFFSFTLILGLRGINVGEDTPTYINIFNSCQDIPFSNLLAIHSLKVPYYTYQGYTYTIEVGFFIWCKLISLISGNAQFFLFCTAGITCFLFAKFIYDNCKSDVFYPTLIFLCESSFMLSFNLVRQMMACAIAVQAYKMLTNNKVFKPLIILSVAFLIHNTAIVTFILMLLLFFNGHDKKHVFNLASMLAIFLPILTIISQGTIAKLFPTYSLYYTNNYYQSSFGIGSLLLIVIELSGIIYMYIKKFKVSETAGLSFLILVNIAFQIVGLKIVMLSRMAIYFRVYLMLFYNKLSDSMPQIYRKLFKGVLIIVLILFYLSFAHVDSRSYSFFWN